MTLRILSFVAAVAILASCSEKAPTACECSDIIKLGSGESKFAVCQDLMKEAAFRKEVGECTVKSIVNGGSSAISESALVPADNGSFIVDTQTSEVIWMGTNVTGKTHQGVLKFFSGEFVIENSLVTSGKFTLDMNSLTNTDISSEESNAKLVKHLKSEDFFDVAKHNTATFVINRTQDSGNGSCLVYGDLTIKGITKPKMAELILNQRDNTLMIAGLFNFDRAEYDVRYGSGKFFENLGDDLIKDDIEMRVKVFAKIPSAS